MSRLRVLGPIVPVDRRGIAPVPPKQADPFYSTPEWKALKRACFARDGGRCTAPGCAKPAIVCDHVVSRRNGGADALHNLRSLCREHDNRVKEDASGARRSGGDPNAAPRSSRR